MHLSYIVLYLVVLNCKLFNCAEDNTQSKSSGPVERFGQGSGKQMPLDVNLRIPHSPLYTFIENPRKVTTIYQYFIRSGKIGQLTDGNICICTVPDGARSMDLMIISDKKTDKAILVRLVYETCCSSKIQLYHKDNNVWMTVEHDDFVNKWRSIDPIDVKIDQSTDDELIKQAPIVIKDNSLEVIVDVSVRFIDGRLSDGKQTGTHTVMYYYTPLTGTKNKIKKLHTLNIHCGNHFPMNQFLKLLFLLIENLTLHYWLNFMMISSVIRTNFILKK